MNNLEGADRTELETMADAGAQILECYRLLQKGSANVVGEILREQGEFFEWDHYPNGDIYDHETHSQFYYHAHPPENRANKWGAEHGHFHTFLRPKGMPASIKPVKLADLKEPADDNDALTHFVGVSMDNAGYPIRIFTTNRWVTGETWYSSGDVKKMLGLFHMDMATPSWPTNIWLTNLLKLFKPVIEDLLDQRDLAVADWETRHPGVNAYEDRDLEITSIVDISVEKQISKVEKALKELKA
jgi:hypothetical protein